MPVTVIMLGAGVGVLGATINAFPTVIASDAAGVMRYTPKVKASPSRTRLNPANREASLFDDVIWVNQTRVEHLPFTDILGERGVDVVFPREMLEVELADPVARKWVLDAGIADNTVGVGLATDLHA